MNRAVTIRTMAGGRVRLAQPRSRYGFQLLMVCIFLFVSGWLAYELRSTPWSDGDDMSRAAETALWWLPFAVVAGLGVVYCLWQAVTALLGMSDILVDSGKRIVARGGRVLAMLEDIRTVDLKSRTGDGYAGDLEFKLAHGGIITIDHTTDQRAMAVTAESLAALLAVPLIRTELQPSIAARLVRLLNLQYHLFLCRAAYRVASAAAAGLANWFVQIWVVMWGVARALGSQLASVLSAFVLRPARGLARVLSDWLRTVKLVTYGMLSYPLKRVVRAKDRVFRCLGSITAAIAEHVWKLVRLALPVVEAAVLGMSSLLETALAAVYASTCAVGRFLGLHLRKVWSAGHSVLFGLFAAVKNMLAITNRLSQNLVSVFCALMVAAAIAAARVMSPIASSTAQVANQVLRIFQATCLVITAKIGGFARLLAHHAARLLVTLGRAGRAMLAIPIAVAAVAVGWIRRAFVWAWLALLAALARARELVRGSVYLIRKMSSSAVSALLRPIAILLGAAKDVVASLCNALVGIAAAMMLLLQWFAAALRLRQICAWCGAAAAVMVSAAKAVDSWLNRSFGRANHALVALGKAIASKLSTLVTKMGKVAGVALAAILAVVARTLTMLLPIAIAGFGVLRAVVRFLFAAAVPLKALVGSLAWRAIAAVFAAGTLVIASFARGANRLRHFVLGILSVKPIHGASVYQTGSRNRILLIGIAPACLGIFLLLIVAANLDQPLASCGIAGAGGGLNSACSGLWAAASALAVLCFISWRLLKRDQYQVCIFPSGKILCRRVIGSAYVEASGIRAVDATLARARDRPGIRGLRVYHGGGTISIQDFGRSEELLAELVRLSPAIAVTRVYEIASRLSVVARSIGWLSGGPVGLMIAWVLFHRYLASFITRATPIESFVVSALLLVAVAVSAGCFHRGWNLFARLPYLIHLKPNDTIWFRRIAGGVLIDSSAIDAVEFLGKPRKDADFRRLRIHYATGVIPVPQFDLMGELAFELLRLSAATSTAKRTYQSQSRHVLTARSLLEIAAGVATLAAVAAWGRQPILHYLDSREVAVLYMAGVLLLGAGAILVWLCYDCWRLLMRVPYQISIYSTGTILFRELARTQSLRAPQIRALGAKGRQRSHWRRRVLCIRCARGAISVKSFDKIEDFVSDLIALNPAIARAGTP